MYITLNLILSVFGFTSHFTGILSYFLAFPTAEYFTALSGTFRLK